MNSVREIFACALLVFFCCQYGVAFAQTKPPQSVSTPTITYRVEPVGTLRLDNGAGPPSWTYFIPIVGPILSGLLAFIGVWLGLKIAADNTNKSISVAQSNSDATVWQKANETELGDIQAKLDGFYIPFQLLSQANHQFAQDLRSRQAEPQKYRMLMKLFDKEWLEGLSAGDRKLVEIVGTNAEELRGLIASKSGLVDDKILPYLSRASAHFRILNLAFKGVLGTDPKRFTDYVYPRELDGVIALEIRRLRNRMEVLRANPSVRPDPLESLAIPEDLKLSSWVDPDGRLINRAAE